MTIRNLRLILFSLFVMTFSTAIAQIPNSGFELWETDPFNNLNPTGWETTNDDPDISVEQYSPAKQGNYSMRVFAFDPGFIPIGGIATTVFPYTLRPSTFNGWVKSTVMPGDAAYIIVSLWKGDTIIAAADSCTFIIDSTINEYKYFSFSLGYQSALAPDSASIMVVAGNFGGAAIGTELIIDEIAFGQGVGIDGNKAESIVAVGPAYPNPSAGIVFLPVMFRQNTQARVEIYSLSGILIRSFSYGHQNEGQQKLELPTEGLPDGIYTYRLSGTQFEHSGKFTIGYK